MFSSNPEPKKGKKIKRPVQFCLYLYRFLVRAYPIEFRREYGPLMLQVFRDACCEAFENKGSRGLLKLIWHTWSSDLIKSAFLERCRMLNKKKMLLAGFTVFLALLFSFILGYVNLEASQAQAPFGLLLVFNFGFAVVYPRVAWAWALLFGSTVPLSYIIGRWVGFVPPHPPVPADTSGLFILIIPALIAAYFGVLTRKFFEVGKAQG